MGLPFWDDAILATSHNIQVLVGINVILDILDW